MLGLSTLTPEQRETAGTLFRGGSAWAAVGITSWSDLAAALAALYSAMLIVEWCWRRFLRDWAVSRGWVKPKPPKTPPQD